jgi:uncharacterized protein YdhG (YjbR/CyaY superfamily)
MRMTTMDDYLDGLAGAIGAVEDRLGGFDVAKGTIRFTPDSPVPDDVLTDLVRARAREIDGS